MANELQLQVNGKSVTVTASPETPLLYVLTDESGAARATLRVRARPVRVLLRPGGRSGDPVVHHAHVEGGRQIADDVGGAAGVLRDENETGVDAGAASAAGGA